MRSEHSLIVGNVALIATDGLENQADLNNSRKQTHANDTHCICAIKICVQYNYSHLFRDIWFVRSYKATIQSLIIAFNYSLIDF